MQHLIFKVLTSPPTVWMPRCKLRYLTTMLLAINENTIQYLSRASSTKHALSNKSIFITDSAMLLK